MAKKRKIGELGESPPGSPPSSGRTLRTRTNSTYVEEYEEEMTEAHVDKGFMDDSDEGSSYEQNEEADVDANMNVDVDSDIESLENSPLKKSGRNATTASKSKSKSTRTGKAMLRATSNRILRSAAHRTSRPTASVSATSESAPSDESDDSARDPTTSTNAKFVGGKLQVIGKKGQKLKSSRQPTTNLAGESDSGPNDDEEEDKKVTKYRDSWKYKYGINLNQREFNDISTIVSDMAQKFRNHPGFSDFIEKSNRQPITVATMCSGTESPLLIIELFRKELKKSGVDMRMDHVFSAEIEIFKQRYIQRNFHPRFIIRDITEFLVLNTPGHTIENTEFTTIYGSKKSIPRPIDLLIAGTVCVDFSALNNKPKGLEQRGESGDTFFSLVTFMKYFRPSIVILENIKNAPWVEGKKAGAGNKKKAKSAESEEDAEGAQPKNAVEKHALDWYMHQIDYATKVFPVDTKMYYLPQTRQRCYMVCLNNESEVDTNHGFDTKLEPQEDEDKYNKDYSDKPETMLDECSDVLDKTKHSATAAVDSFLLDNDDPRIHFFKGGDEDSREPVRWDKCELGHHDYRTSLKLGIDRALTRWVAGGASILPDFWDKAVPYMTSRVLDTLEISHLRNFVRGFDDRFVSRFLELSQNVFRTTDMTPVGIMPCLTPTGIPFCTSRGRRVTGLESLILQGIPVNQLDLSFLSQRNLQDLAGNAMSTTVVGAVIMSSLVSCHSVIKPRITEEVFQEEVVTCNFIRESDLVKTTCDSGPQERTAEVLQNLAEKTVSFCDCEGMHAIKLGMKKCKVCGHTACTECGKNPNHTYEIMDVDRVNPTPHMMNFFDLLPMTFNMDFGPDLEKFSENLKNLAHNKLDRNIWDKVFERVSEATRYLLPIRTIIRRRSWEITYQNENAKVALTISPSKVEWLWYLRAPDLPKGNHLRKLLDEFPFARMIPVGNEDFMEGRWEFWVPYPQKAMMRVESSGESIQTYGAHLGVVSGTNKFHKNQVSVEYYQTNAELVGQQIEQLEDVVGTYRAYPDCGQAFNSMHVKNDFTKGNPMFLYFYHNLQRGAPTTFSFVFTPNQRRVEEGKYLRPVAYFDPSWRQPEFTGTSNDAAENIFESKIQDVTLSMDGYWFDGRLLFPSVNTQREVIYHQLPPTVRPVNCLPCHSTMAILTCESNAQGMMESDWPRDKWIIIDRSNEDYFVRDFRWMFQRGIKMTGHLAKDEWRRIVQFPTNRCSSTCAPVSPSMQWKLMHKQTKKKRKSTPSADKPGDAQVDDDQNEGGQNGDGEKMPRSKRGSPAPKQYPFENPEEADIYEVALGARPPLLSIMLYVSRSGHVQIKIGANVSTILHRAIAYLTDGGAGGQVEAFWRLVTDDDTSPLTDYFEVEIPSSKDETMAAQPPNWNMARKLRPEQLRSLQWQLGQENNPPKFFEQEIVTATIHLAGAYVEGKATRPITVMGGILAQEVGFGKTATSLGLIATQRPQDRAPIKPPGLGYYRSNATVIFVPSQLTQQWEAEVYSFMPNQDRQRVIVVKSPLSLDACSIEKIKQAEIIIISMSVISSTTYFRHLAEFGGLPEVDLDSNMRHQSEWLKICLNKIRESVRVLQNNPEDLFSHLQSRFYSNLEKAASTFAFVPAKRTKGAAYVSKVAREEKNDLDSYVIEKQTRDHSRFKVPDTYIDDIKFMEAVNGVPFLHLFQFARLIIDELSYCDKIEGGLINTINAERRWALSGTPGLDTFEDVAKVAKVLKINLGRTDWSAQANAAARVEMTDAEKLESYQSPQSRAWYLQRNQHAQTFINHFVRRDVAEPGAISHRTHLRLVTLPPAELALYTELEQSQVASNFEEHNRKGQAIATELDRRLEQALVDCEHPLQAFVALATSFKFGVDTATEQRPKNAADLCSTIVKVRKNEYNVLMDLFEVVLKNTEWLERNRERPKLGRKENADDFLNWKHRLRTNQTEYKDLTVINEILEKVNDAEKNYTEDDWKEFYRKENTGNTGLPLKPSNDIVVKGQQKFGQSQIAAALRQKVALLNRMSNELVNLQRKYKFMDSIHHLQTDKTFSLWTSNLQEMLYLCPEGTSGTVSKYGQKIDEVIKLIKYIPQDDKVLIFVQSRKVRISVKEALVKEEIIAFDLNSGKDPATTLTAFQNDTKLEMPEDPTEKKARLEAKTKKIKRYHSRAKVLILNIGDVTSAGSNLTNANHVIFISPYLTEGANAQRIYEDHRTQAIGRARRFGQTKTVHIYDFITKFTIDVDIIEYRTGMHIRYNFDDNDSDGCYETEDDIVPSRRPYFGFVNSGAQLVHPAPDEVSDFKSRIADQLRLQFRRGW
ncbi:hypothetical protein B7494_g4306 [Chlorociboria aeruginascens]|nr:hypothetical protein B7494_g4306 [Chlorociboria aeruginascens]